MPEQRNAFAASGIARILLKDAIALRFSVALLIGWIPISGRTETPDTESAQVSEAEPDWTLSIIAGGFSKHLTTTYEPANGYTERHSNLGVEIGQAGPGWVASAQATWFKDSHNEDSFLGVGAFGYRLNLPHRFFVYGGLGAGYAETSYYAGLLVMPFAELGWWRISAQGSYLPKVPDADSGLAAQLKFRIFEW